MKSAKKSQEWVCLVMPKKSWWAIQDALAIEDTQDSGELRSALESIKRADLKSKTAITAIKRVMLAAK
jgi:hypothetical protein